MRTYHTITLITITIAAALLATSTARNSTWGHHGFYDRLLNRTQVVRKSALWQVTTYDFVFPPRNVYNPYYITEVRAIDNKKKDGGYAVLRRGGPGYRNVTLHIKSDRNHGFSYTVEIYGY